MEIQEVSEYLVESSYIGEILCIYLLLSVLPKSLDMTPLSAAGEEASYIKILIEYVLEAFLGSGSKVLVLFKYLCKVAESEVVCVDILFKLIDFVGLLSDLCIAFKNAVGKILGVILEGLCILAYLVDLSVLGIDSFAVLLCFSCKLAVLGAESCYLLIEGAVLSLSARIFLAFSTSSAYAFAVSAYSFIFWRRMSIPWS